jgi:hypothetical protein
MNRCRFAVVLLTLAALTRPALAGIFFNRHPKPNPSERVPALLTALKTEADDRKREAAAEELSKYDPTQFPEMIPVLAEASQQDRSAGVRLEALRSLERLRPVSQRAGSALEQAASRDASLRVRLQARSLLWQYHLGGYRSGGSGNGTQSPMVSSPVQTTEPPLAPPLPPAPAPKAVAPAPKAVEPAPKAAATLSRPTRLNPTGETPPPPLADPGLDPTMARPLPQGPKEPSLAPAAKPVKTPPAPDAGPELTRPD